MIEAYLVKVTGNNNIIGICTGPSERYLVSVERHGGQRNVKSKALTKKGQLSCDIEPVMIIPKLIPVEPTRGLNINSAE